MSQRYRRPVSGEDETIQQGTDLSFVGRARGPRTTLPLNLAHFDTPNWPTPSDLKHPAEEAGGFDGEESEGGAI